MNGGNIQGRLGRVKLHIVGACPEDLLQALSQHEIPFWGYVKADELSAMFWIRHRDLFQVRSLCKKAMVEDSVLETCGILPAVRGTGRRVLLLPVIVLLLVLALYLQTHIWFFTVTGNETIPEEEILWALESCGVSFGTGKFDLNLVKNQMLSKLPSLRWLTINIHGGFAEVVVREREEMPVVAEEAGPRNLVAEKSGLIEEVLVTTGDPMVEAGELVEAGQLLISGVTDLEKTTLLSRAEGEVYARTWTDKTAILPNNLQKKQYTGEKSVRLSLQIGKKTINFFKTGSISYGEYDKIIVKKPLTLPGGYELPLSVTVVTFREYESLGVEPSAPWDILTECLLTQVRQRLVAGSILDHDLHGSREEDRFLLSGTVECREEIGKGAEISD